MADKNILLNRYAENDDDRILLSQLYDRLHAAEMRSIPAFSHFLAPREQALARAMLSDFPLTLFGGYAEAERRLACYLPEYLAEECLSEPEFGPISVLRATYYKSDALTHRDFLGSLLGCGIKREMLGDILVGEGSTDILVVKEMVPFLLDNYVSAGRTVVHLEEVPLAELAVPQADLSELRVTVSSLRLDALLAAGFRLSRGKAEEAIAGGRVAVNDLPCFKADKQVGPGDKLTLRGLGKIVFRELGGHSKKDRLCVVLEVYGRK